MDGADCDLGAFVDVCTWGRTWCAVFSRVEAERKRSVIKDQYLEVVKT